MVYENSTLINISFNNCVFMLQIILGITRYNTVLLGLKTGWNGVVLSYTLSYISVHNSVLLGFTTE